METIVSRNPQSGKILQELQQTPIDLIPELIKSARAAQTSWSLMSVRQRAKILLNAKEYILDNIDEIAKLISDENGKPKFEAYTNDIMDALEVISVYGKRAPKLLRQVKIPLRWVKHKRSYLEYWPKGVIGVISPWNYPFSIPFGEITLALLAGNAVIFKPSEVTPLTGLKIAEIFEHSLLPKNLLQVVLGGGAHGAAIIHTRVDHICFTGSVATGKKVMTAAAEHLTPVTLELGGKDPMIVLPDADIDYATSAALWGSYSNSGQTCASIERVIVHESIHDNFVQILKEKLSKLRHSADLSDTDLGVVTYDIQKKVYESQLSELNSTNSKILCGGKFSEDRTYLEPTIVVNPDGSKDSIEGTAIYNDETFGPVTAITKYRSTPEAIEKANRSRYGLSASIIGKNLSLAKQIAEKLEAGTVMINEVLYTHALSETPWGGVKESGIGRVHSDHGLMEFVNARHVHVPRSLIPIFKDFWWFPYGKHQMEFFRHVASVLYRKSILKKLAALPNLLVELVQMIKKEPRI